MESKPGPLEPALPANLRLGNDEPVASVTAQVSPSPPLSAVTPPHADDWTRIKILEKYVPVYAAASGNAKELFVLTDSPEAQMHPPVSGFALIKLADGREGFISGRTKIYRMQNAILTQDNVALAKNPNTSAPVIATLPNGTKITVRNTPLETDGVKWIEISANSEIGFILGSVKVKFLTAPAPVRPGAPNPATKFNLMTGDLRAPIPAAPASVRRPVGKPKGSSPAEQHAINGMMINGIVFVAGVSITVATYSAASGSGGTYVVTWGAILFGGARFVIHLANYVEARRKVARR